MTEPSPTPPGEIADVVAPRPSGIAGRLAKVDGVDCYRIDGVGEMEPFLMAVTSSTDLWMFLSSRGTLTAGRSNADMALLPYETDDRIHRAVGIAGPVTIVARSVAGRRELWRPFGREAPGEVRRSLAKALSGDRVIFEEVRDDWGLTFRVTWMPSPAFGWVRRVDLVDHGGSGAELEVLDGLLDVVPAGVDSVLQQIRSNLVNAYKRSETGHWGSAAIYTLEALITDKAEPAESLAATVVWADGAPWAEVHLDERLMGAMVEGRAFRPEALVTGRRGSYLLRGNLRLEPGATTSWLIVADAGLDHARVLDRVGMAAGVDALRLVESDIESGNARLRVKLESADGFQHTGDPIADAHHLSNVLFNIMRGGVFPHGQGIPVAGLLDHLACWNRPVHLRFKVGIEAFGEMIEVEELRRFALDSGDPDLMRLVLEYIPLTFSRRHGDPSRPWNRFSIRRSGPDGEEGLGYEGNWRDIFQNWEALLLSYPAYLPNVVAKFVDASTVDGHNPYRLSHDGVDWEVPDPHDPWSNIGYWGDHQIVYLHRLLAAWDRAEPGGVGAWLNRRVFAYADVPYVIAGYSAMVRDPRNTIEYDTERAARVVTRSQEIGADGRLVVDDRGQLVRVGLMEKLLVPLLAKLISFVPGGGIWMNTQRPEWNDANNALAGFGLSMVTLYHLYGYITWLRGLLGSQPRQDFPMSASVAGLLSDVVSTLEGAKPDAVDDALLRREVMDDLGEVGSRYRASVRSAFDASSVAVGSESIERLCVTALDHLWRTIERGRRPDGLYDAYNVVSFPGPGEANVHSLGPMLEGQVAILSSGALGASESIDLLDTLYASQMYRPDQDSFMLYPAPELGRFLDRNTIPAERLVDLPFMNRLGPEILVKDASGNAHFSSGMVNRMALEAVMGGSQLSSEERIRVAELYEEVFGHHAYTGRSGSMYGYEGIGSIYWHMVGKLLLAVQETYWEAVDNEAAPDVLARLVLAYRRIRAGLGFCKGPVEYGAIPIDCYSHTPAHSGAQQPGMTGQVKEEILTRFGELGIRLVEGRLALAPGLLPVSAVLAADGGPARFGFCGVEVSITAGVADQHRLLRDSTWSAPIPGLVVDAPTSKEILWRAGPIQAIEFSVARWPEHRPAQPGSALSQRST